MLRRSVLPLAIFVAACSVGVDSPVGVETPNVNPSFDVVEGVKPPPPIGSGDVEITLSYTPPDLLLAEAALGGPSASALELPAFSAKLTGRYFSNSPLKNGWIQFVSNDQCTASEDARLQYNGNGARTTGHGTLTCGSVTLDLTLILITNGGFGNCTFDGFFDCDDMDFSYDGVAGGRLDIGPVPIITD